MRFIKECFQRPPDNNGKGPWPHRAAEPWRSMNKVADKEGYDGLFADGELSEAGREPNVAAPSKCIRAQRGARSLLNISATFRVRTDERLGTARRFSGPTSGWVPRDAPRALRYRAIP